jgi:hypothetical protein
VWALVFVLCRGMVSLSNLNQLGFFAGIQIIHEDVDLGQPDKPKKCFYRTLKGQT